ncbi:MAG TPA: S41 family peptidase [Steroidobacteraceae bacterium]
MHKKLAAIAVAATAVAALLFWSPASQAGTKLLRFPNIWHDKIVFSYAGDLWTVGSQGGTATRLTSHAGLKLFAKFSPDGRFVAFMGQYGGDEQVYVMPADGGAPQQLTFYPTPGPLAERWGFDNQVYGWTPDGSRVLFRSMRDAYGNSEAKLYTVPMAGGAATALPMPKSGAGSFSADGKQIVYSPLWRDFRSEKRYGGGQANVLYLFGLTDSSVKQITHGTRADRDPMWIGGAVYFNSDRSGTFNLYRYDIASQQIEQITHYQDWDVRWPSADGLGQIIYELDGELHVYETRGGQDRALSILVPADITTRRPQQVNAADNIESTAISPGGERVAVVARGDVFSVPVEFGATRNLTHSSNAHEREAAWSHDGKRLAYVSDISGEEEIYVQSQDGNSPAVAVTQNSSTRYLAPAWSADDKRIAFADSANHLYVVDVAARKRSVVAHDPVNLNLDHRWSPDGQYLAYSLNEDNSFSGIFVWSAADGKSHRVTPQLFNAQSPAWAPNGELLYFLSQREYQPIVGTIEFNFATDRQTGIFAVTLRKGIKNPFGIRDNEPGDAKDDEADKDKDKAKDKDAKNKHIEVKIEFDGIEQRTIRVPLEPDDISNLQAGDESLLYLRSGPSYYGRESSVKPTVMAYSIKEREAKPVAEDVTDWSATANGKHVLALMASKELKYLEVGKSEDAKAVSLSGLATTRVPAEEWREIFAEVWRRYRDYFYVENMHGFDWNKLRAKYQPLLEDVANRADLNYVISEMIAELTVQHAYIEGGDLGLPKRPFVALPGARFELDTKSGRYRIARIFAGENEEEHYRSPLTEVGVDAHVGDYVLSINGRDLKAGTDPYELLQAPADQPVEWRVATGADGSGARTIRYRPLKSETALLYLAWANANRARVDTLSHGRLGYIHLPDMGEAGFREFIKWWYPQVPKEGLVVDARDNGGGNISQMLLERLAARLRGTRFSRNQTVTGTYPSVVQPGPKAALINETTGSDGDIFAYQFRDWKIGQLIGKRTWGGVVGITDHGTLLDGGKVYVPEFGTADAAGHWIIEGHGVDPDIEVEQSPADVLRGSDPQLERAVLELMKLLPAVPGGLPKRPAPPIKTEGGS